MPDRSKKLRVTPRLGGVLQQTAFSCSAARQMIYKITTTSVPQRFISSGDGGVQMNEQIRFAITWFPCYFTITHSVEKSHS